MLCFPNLVDHRIPILRNTYNILMSTVPHKMWKAARNSPQSHPTLRPFCDGDTALGTGHTSCVISMLALEPLTHRKRRLARVCSLTGPPQMCCCPRPRRRSPEAPWRWYAAARGSRLRSSPGSSAPFCTRLSPGPVWPVGHLQSSSVAGQENRRPSK